MNLKNENSKMKNKKRNAFNIYFTLSLCNKTGNIIEELFINCLLIVY